VRRQKGNIPKVTAQEEDPGFTRGKGKEKGNKVRGLSTDPLGSRSGGPVGAGGPELEFCFRGAGKDPRAVGVRG